MIKVDAKRADVDRINEAIDRIRQPLDAKAREERIIHAGYVVGLLQGIFLSKLIQVKTSQYWFVGVSKLDKTDRSSTGRIECYQSTL